jgi:uncharacterized protein YijF (DUF1287 family)
VSSSGVLITQMRTAKFLLISIAMLALLLFVPVRAQVHSQKEFAAKLVAAAIERTHHSVRYVSDYVRMSYPGGDVPANTGVCTDEVIRIYRMVGVDLQKEVHEDMLHNFSAYLHRWQTQPDANIDQRHVPNLMVFFARKGIVLPIKQSASDYSAGDIVAWNLGGGITHIGMVVDRRGPSRRYMVVHNIGRGRKWKMCSSIGKSSGIIGTSGRTPEFLSVLLPVNLFHAF